MDFPILNCTQYPADTVPFDVSKRPFMTLIAKGAFHLVNGDTAACAAEQHPLMGTDILIEHPLITAVRYESDFVPFKPRADVLCVGRAYPPQGIHRDRFIVSFGVGSWMKRILVFGNRRWTPLLGRFLIRPSAPAPFESIAVSYEHAYGGRDAGDPERMHFFAANAIGKGYTTRRQALNGLALPNLEDPEHPIKHWTDHPEPRGFGPVGRTWHPRLRKAGTYDQKWLSARAPDLPEDFDEGYYNCAPEDQQIAGYLRGDEEVRVVNMHPNYPTMTCRLPGIRLRCLVDRPHSEGARLEEIPFNLDTLWVDMEALTLVLVWRGRFATAGLPENTPLLLVREELSSAPRPPESYRTELLAYLEAEGEDDQEVEEAAVERTSSVEGEA